jgi:hypothetical protein
MGRSGSYCFVGFVDMGRVDEDGGNILIGIEARYGDPSCYEYELNGGNKL